MSEVDDVIKKFTAQKETAKNLAAMTLEAQTRIDSLNARIEASKEQAEKLKYTGAAPAGGNRRVLDELEAQLSEATARQERLHARQERVAKLLVALRAGAEHLAELLEPVKLDAAPAAKAEGADAALQLCQARLAHMLQALAGEEAAQRTALADPARLAALAFPASDESAAHVLRRDTLQRMDSLLLSDEDDGEELADDEDGEGMDEVLDRDAVKSTSERHRVGSAKKPAGKPAGKAPGGLAGGATTGSLARKAAGTGLGASRSMR